MNPAFTGTVRDMRGGRKVGMGANRVHACEVRVRVGKLLEQGVKAPGHAGDDLDARGNDRYTPGIDRYALGNDGYARENDQYRTADDA
jgi:hypothetical protein